jgi:HEAT repeat protein
MRTATFVSVAGTLLLPAALLAHGPQDKAKLEMKRSVEPINGKTMLEWMNDLKSKDPSVVKNAIVNLKAYGQEARDASKDLVKFASPTKTKVQDVSLRVNAIISLGFIGFRDSDLQEGVGVLRDALHDSQEIVRYQAAVALRRLQAKAYPATPDLMFAMQTSTSRDVRRAAAAALGIVARENPVDKGFDSRAFTALLERLTMNSGAGDIDQEVRMEAIIALIRFGLPGALPDRSREKQALSAQASNSRQAPKVAIWAQVGLWMLDRGTQGQNVPAKTGQQHLATIARFLKNNDLQAREHAVRALGVIGPEAGSHVPDLIDVLEDKNSDIVVLACMALSSMAEVAKEALPVLERMSHRHSNPKVREAARQAIETIKEKQQEQGDRVPGRAVASRARDCALAEPENAHTSRDVLRLSPPPRPGHISAITYPVEHWRQARQPC